MSKEVMLINEVPGLGVEGDIVRVADGYARNFLVPRGIAAPVTTATRRQMEKLRKAREARLAEARVEAEALRDRIEALSVSLSVKVGEQGKLFGSVTVQDIVAAVKKQGVEIDRHQVLLEEALRETGVFNVPVKLHPEVQASIKVWVVEA